MRILIITYYFPPSTAVGGKRYKYFADELTKLGHRVTVVTANWGSEFSDLGYSVMPIGPIISYNPHTASTEQGVEAFKHPSLIFRSLDRSIFNNWYKETKTWIQNNSDYIKGQDIVLAGYKPLADIYLAKMIKKNYNIPFVLDLRDLISQFGRKKRILLLNLIDELLDKWTVADAEIITCTSYKSQEKARKIYKKPVEIITNGFSGEPRLLIQTAGRINKLRIVYTGTISGIRNPRPIYELIKKYNETSKMKIYLEIASAQNPAEFIKEESEYVKWHGFLSPEETIKLQINADICLLLEDQTINGVENIPAKIYEYIGIQKPVLGYCHPESDIGIILQRTGLGKIITDYNSFVSFVSNIEQIKPNIPGIMEFSHKNIARHLETLLIKATSKSSSNNGGI